MNGISDYVPSLPLIAVHCSNLQPSFHSVCLFVYLPSSSSSQPAHLQFRQTALHPPSIALPHHPTTRPRLPPIPQPRPPMQPSPHQAATTSRSASSAQHASCTDQLRIPGPMLLSRGEFSTQLSMPKTSLSLAFDEETKSNVWLSRSPATISYAARISHN